MIEEIEEIIPWKIVISASADKRNLSDEQLKSIFNCFKHEEYQDFRNKMIEKDKMYDIYPVGKWQLKKAREIEELWHNNINYTIDNNIVNVSINLKINYPISFDDYDVIEWTEGIRRLQPIYSMVQMKNMINCIPVEEDENRFIDELCDNCKIKIEKIES